jgi:hypothetical protein
MMCYDHRIVIMGIASVGDDSERLYGRSYWLIFRVEMSTTEKLRECMYNRSEIGGTGMCRRLTAVVHSGSDTGLQVQQHGGELE